MAASEAPPFMGLNNSNQKKPSNGGWHAAIFIIFVEVAERFSYYGLAVNLITFLTNVLGEPIVTAAKNVNIWVGVSAIFPLLGGFIADSYLGRFKTIVISSIIYLMATVLLTLSVSVVSPTHRRAVFFTALYLLAFGEGGHKPCVQTFAADQFDDNSPEEKVAKSSFFNWWYLGVVLGATLGVAVPVYLQDNVGWTAGFGILAAVVAVALGLFFTGIPKYRREGPVGSPITRVVQVFVAAARKWRVNCEGRSLCFDDGAQLKDGGFRSLVQTNQFRFLDKAAIIDDTDALSRTRNYWRLCSVNQVEEVKLLLRLVPIWFSCMIFAIVVAQQTTFYTKQGSTMIRSIGPHFQMPPASVNAFAGITIITAVLIYDRALVPIAKSITGHPSGITILQRMGIGMVFSILTMIVAAIVEAKRVSIAKENGLLNIPKATVPMSIWWLTPQYILSGLADAFTIVGMQELFYDQMPDKMRSMGAATYISTVGIGNLMSSAVITIVHAVSSRFGNEWLGNNLNRSYLDYFYWTLAGLSGLNLCLYIWFAMGFVYKKVELDENSKGRRVAEA